MLRMRPPVHPPLSPSPPLFCRAQGSGDKEVSDQHLEAFTIVDEAGKPVGTIEDNDAVVLFNFRADRMVEMSKAFEYADFATFDRQRVPKVRACVRTHACMRVCRAPVTGWAAAACMRPPS